MVMALAPIVPDSVAGGLFGGPCSATVAGGIAGGACGTTAAGGAAGGLCGATVSGGVAGGVGGGGCWANRVAAGMKRPVQTKRRFMGIFLLWAETLLLVGRLQRDDCRTLRPVGITGSGSWGAISGNRGLFRCRMTQGRCMVEPSNQSSLGARFRAAGWEEKPLQGGGRNQHLYGGTGRGYGVQVALSFRRRRGRKIRCACRTWASAPWKMCWLMCGGLSRPSGAACGRLTGNSAA